MLRQELHQLKPERLSVIAAIAEARSHGDLKENAEYDAAKERQGFVEGRIKEVEGSCRWRRSSTRACRRRWALRCLAQPPELEDHAETEESAVTYQIVGDDEADIKLGKI